MSRFGLSNPYLSSGLAGSVGSKFSELSAHQRAALYWPGIQGLISNPAVWRDRFVLSSEYNNLVNNPKGRFHLLFLVLLVEFSTKGAGGYGQSTGDSLIFEKHA